MKSANIVLNREQANFQVKEELIVSERITGTVKWFDASKGYGYIEAGLGEEVFVHYQAIAGNGFKNLLAGDRVEFSINRRPRGPVALEVTRA